MIIKKKHSMKFLLLPAFHSQRSFFKNEVVWGDTDKDDGKNIEKPTGFVFLLRLQVFYV